MSITNLTIPYSTPYQVSADDIDLIKIRSLETSPLTHEDLDDNFANLMNKVNALVDTIGGSSAAISVDGSGNVGIGTATPDRLLHVSGGSGSVLAGKFETASTSGSMIVFKDADTTTNDLQVRIGSDANDLVQYAGGSERMRIDSSGRVGIGTTNPTKPLHILSTVVDQIVLEANSTTIGPNMIFKNTDGNLARIRTDDSENLHFENGTVNTTRMTIDTNGNVGIGTVTPSATLHVKANDDAENAMAFWVVDKTHTNSIITAYENGDVKIGSNFIYKDDLDRVGIGTTSPVGKLDVTQSGGGVFINLQGNTSGNVKLRMSPQGSSTQSSYIEAINNGTNTDLKLNESLYLKHNGNVGIGTTNPSAALHIKASSLGQEGLIVENSLGNQTAHIGHLTDGTAYFKLADATGQNHTLLRDNSDSYLNALGGNVGIGTTNPSAKLEINSGTNDASLRLVSTDPYVDIKMSDDTTTDDGVRISNKGDDLLLQRTGGNVGIGTTSPEAKLEILNGSSTTNVDALTFKWEHSNQTTGIEQRIKWRFGDDTTSNAFSSPSAYIGVGKEGAYTIEGNRKAYISFGTENGSGYTASEKMRIAANGNVGIGTTSPNATLDIQGTAKLNGADLATVDQLGGGGIWAENTSGAYYNGNVGIGTTSPDSKLHLSTTGLDGLRLSVDSQSYYHMIRPNGDGLYIGADEDSSGGSGADIRLNIKGDEKMRIDSNGNVGIGTTSPSANLHVLKDMGSTNVDGSFTLQKTAYTRSSSHPEGSGQFMTHKLHELSYSGDFSTNGNNHLNDTIIGLDVNLDTNAGGQYAALFNGGHVGIGTTNPSAKLDISTNNTTGLRLINPDSAAANQSNDPPAILFQASGWDTDVGSRAYSARIRVNSNYSGAPDRGNTHPVMNFDLETNENNPDDTLSTKMMINADGKVGIGTTDPSDKLDITGDINNLGISITNGAAGHPARVTLANNEGSGTIDANNGQLRLGNGSSGSNDLVIDSDGRVGIGTTSPSAQLHIIDAHGNGSTSASGQLKLSNISTNGGTWGIHTTADNWNAGGGGKLGFFADDNANQARMIITQAGNVGIGLTTPDCKLTVVTDNALSGYAMKIGAGGGGQEDRGLHIAAGRTVPNGAGQCVYIGFHDGDGTATGGIRCSANPSTPEFFSSSDIRMKKNIEDCDINGIEKIKSLKLRKWDWNTEKDMPPTDLGLIADELEEVYPELVSRQKMEGWEHCVSEGEEDLKTIPSESKITLTLVKAIQEQQTIIEDLKSRIVTLEGGSPEPDKAEEPVVEEVLEEPVAEEAPEPQAVEEPQPEPQEVAQVSLGQVSLGQVSVGQVSLSESPLDEIKEIRAEDGKEYIRIGDKDYEVLGKNEDGSLLLDDDVTNNG
jgi:hypothetical protein